MYYFETNYDVITTDNGKKLKNNKYNRIRKDCLFNVHVVNLYSHHNTSASSNNVYLGG